MAQRSLPQAGDETLNPSYTDAGPYTADEWSEAFRLLFTTDQQATQGVLRGAWNELAPANPATRTVTVDMGAGVVNGHVLINDASVSIGVTAGAARNDSLVMLENNSNAAISAGAATNYNTEGNVPIPPYSARLAVVKDDAANFSQTNTLWMTRLATFTTGAAALTNFTDVRDWCQFAGAGGPDTRTLFVPAMAGRTIALPDNIPVTTTGAFGSIAPSVPLPAAISIGTTIFSVPQDFASAMTVQAVVAPELAGNVYSTITVYYGACGQNYNAHTDSSGGYTATAIATGEWNCINSVSLSSAAVDDIVLVRFFRDGTDVLDTVSGAVWFFGAWVEYTPIS